MFCKNCGTQMPDGTAFCPSCGSPAGAQDTQGQQQPNYQQQNYQQPNYQRNRPNMSLDIMSIVALGCGAVGLILGIVALVKGFDLIETMTRGGAARVVLACIALALSIAGVVIGSQQQQAVGQNTFNKVGKILGIIGIIISALGLVICIIGAAISHNVNSLYNDWFDF